MIKLKKQIIKNTKVLGAVLALSFFSVVYGMGFVNFQENGSPEINIADNAVVGEAKAIAASCAFGGIIYDGAYIGDIKNGNMTNPLCGSTCPAGMIPDGAGRCVNGCTNGATNPPSCTTCPVNMVMSGGRCVECQNGGCTRGVCNNGATNPPFCNVCSAPRFYFNGSTCVANPCGSVVPPANYGQSCSGGTNVCGQTSTGSIQCNGTCNATSVNNNSCITFTPTVTSVNPGGSVDFLYRIQATPGYTPKCGFYDRSKDNGVGLGTPIAGLQDLDLSGDRIRINNIQRNTEFCLVCQFTNALGVQSAPAANHQWVRVIRIGEN
jgi:hypothetical protein